MMRKIISLLFVLSCVGVLNAQQQEFVSVCTLDSILSDYYANLNVLCQSTASPQKIDAAKNSIRHILSADPFPTNLYLEMRPDRGVYDNQDPIDVLFDMAKYDTIHHWEYQIRHFNAKNILLGSVSHGSFVYKTAKLLVVVKCYDNKEKWTRNLELFTFVMIEPDVWRIIRTEPVDRLNVFYTRYNDKTLNSLTQFDEFKYQYAESLDSILKPLVFRNKVILRGVAIVHDAIGKVGFVDINGNELLPPVFDSIVFDEFWGDGYYNRGFWGYCDGVRYNIEPRLYRSTIDDKQLLEDVSGVYYDDVFHGLSASNGCLNGDATGCYVSHKPVTWGLWLSVHSGKLPRGCSLDTPVTINDEGVSCCYNIFLKLLDFRDKYRFLSPEECRMIGKDDRYLWLVSSEPFHERLGASPYCKVRTKNFLHIDKKNRRKLVLDLKGKYVHPNHPVYLGGF